ncbi:MAG: metallophosphoesterase [Abditibacteriota bacterium]|nr:metallophosphoesterase [Abditibacteriota bacterium]
MSKKEPTTAELNPDFEDIMLQALRPKNAPEGCHFEKEPKPFSLFCMADLHGDGEELGYLTEFYNHYEKYFNGALCVGDIICDSALSDFTYWGKTPGHEKVMIAIGNHDTLRDHKDWVVPGVWEYQLSMREAYDRYQKDFIAGWDVVYEEGKTYYYKDYPENRVKLIVLDCMLNPEKEKEADDEQFGWFKKALADAKEKDLSVLAAYHYQCPNVVKIDCNFTDIDKLEHFETLESMRYRQAVDDFMSEGGKFVCWLCGHLHWEIFGYCRDFPKQLIRCICGTGRWSGEATGFMTRKNGRRSRDAADVAVVDTSTETLRIVRVGANMDSYMRPRNGITINYKTFEIISEF